MITHHGCVCEGGLGVAGFLFCVEATSCGGARPSTFPDSCFLMSTGVFALLLVLLLLPLPLLLCCTVMQLLAAHVDAAEAGGVAGAGDKPSTTVLPQLCWFACAMAAASTA